LYPAELAASRATLRLGHPRVLTCHRHMIHFTRVVSCSPRSHCTTKTMRLPTGPHTGYPLIIHKHSPFCKNKPNKTNSSRHQPAAVLLAPCGVRI